MVKLIFHPLYSLGRILQRLIKVKSSFFSKPYIFMVMLLSVWVLGCLYIKMKGCLCFWFFLKNEVVLLNLGFDSTLRASKYGSDFHFVPGYLRYSSDFKRRSHLSVWQITLACRGQVWGRNSLFVVVHAWVTFLKHQKWMKSLKLQGPSIKPRGPEYRVQKKREPIKVREKEGLKW